MKLCFHMKSGKTITQRGVKNYNFKWRGNEVVSVNIDLYWWARFSIILGTLDLSSIEAITKH